ncbi:MAG: hypothetical protein U5N86_06060 [Planctomycetota bacterium]|nr:hypothetical protein [Planctomycetota bacterium]
MLYFPEMGNLRKPPVYGLAGDAAFKSGVYGIVMLLFYAVSMFLTPDPSEWDEVSRTSVMVMDYIYVLSTLVTLAFALYVARVRVLFIVAAVLPAFFLFLDIHQSAFEHGFSNELMLSFDYWVFMGIGLVNVYSYFLPDLKKHEYVALAGWSAYVFGVAFTHADVQPAGDDWVGIITGFAPFFAGVFFWCVALWLGRSQYFSQRFS